MLKVPIFSLIKWLFISAVLAQKSTKFCQCKFWMTLSSIPEALEEVAIKPGETIFSACSDAEIEGFDSKALPGSALTDVALDPKLDKDPLKLDEKKID